jgi:hypothetical protein
MIGFARGVAAAAVACAAAAAHADGIADSLPVAPPFVEVEPGSDRPTAAQGPSRPWPGLGMNLDAAEPAQPLVLHVQPGVNHVVRVSAGVLNRIATPFQDALVADASDARISTSAGSVYVLPQSLQPIGIYITDRAAPETLTVALTLVPKTAIPGQNIVVQFEGREHPTAPAGIPPVGQSAPYTEEILSLLRDAVLGSPLQGYTESRVDVGVAEIGPVRAAPDRRWSGRDLELYRYRLTLPAHHAQPVELAEAGFYRAGVRAVALFPEAALAPGGTGFAYVLVGRP